MLKVASFMSWFCALVVVSRLSYRRFVLTTRCCVYSSTSSSGTGSRHVAAIAPELVYGSVSGVGVYVPALEDPVVVEPCVVGAGYRSHGYRCAVVAAWHPSIRGGRGVEEAGNIE